MAKKHLFRCLQIKVCPKGLHSFAFYILIFDFPSHLPLMSLPANTYVHKMYLYNCRETFTDVMSALQIRLFMQNKAKFRKVKLSVNKVLTKDYEQKDTWWSGKKQSQTNPTCRGVASGEAGTNPIKANKMPKQTQYKPNTNPTCRGVASGEAGTNPIHPPQNLADLAGRW
jgi:hypothetical protein